MIMVMLIKEQISATQHPFVMTNTIQYLFTTDCHKTCHLPLHNKNNGRQKMISNILNQHCDTQLHYFAKSHMSDCYHKNNLYAHKLNIAHLLENQATN